MINVVLWICMGSLLGLAATRLTGSSARDADLLHVVAGALGALAGGIIFMIFDTAPLSIINPWAILLALVGAALMIALTRIIAGRMI